MANPRATKDQAKREAVKTRKGPKPRAEFRQIRGIQLLYGEPVTEKVSVPFLPLGLHAQNEAGIQQDGKISRQKARYVQPELMYEFSSAKKQEELTFILFRGKAEIPINDGYHYEPIPNGMTSDRNPNHNCAAFCYLMTPVEEREE